MPQPTVLIVEDDATLLRGLKDNFQAQDYCVLTAADGRKGLETALAHSPDLIVLDIMLPPTLVSLPFKILLFVLVDGWHLVVGMLMQSFQPVS